MLYLKILILLACLMIVTIPAKSAPTACNDTIFISSLPYTASESDTCYCLDGNLSTAGSGILVTGDRNLIELNEDTVTFANNYADNQYGVSFGVFANDNVIQNGTIIGGVATTLSADTSWSNVCIYMTDVDGLLIKDVNTTINGGFNSRLIYGYESIKNVEIDGGTYTSNSEGYTSRCSFDGVAILFGSAASITGEEYNFKIHDIILANTPQAGIRVTGKVFVYNNHITVNARNDLYLWQQADITSFSDAGGGMVTAHMGSKFFDYGGNYEDLPYSLQAATITGTAGDVYNGTHTSSNVTANSFDFVATWVGTTTGNFFTLTANFCYGTVQSFGIIFRYIDAGSACYNNTVVTGTEHLGADGAIILEYCAGTESEPIEFYNNTCSLGRGNDMYYGLDLSTKGIKYRNSNTYVNIRDNDFYLVADNDYATSHIGYSSEGIDIVHFDGEGFHDSNMVMSRNHVVVEALDNGVLFATAVRIASTNGFDWYGAGNRFYDNYYKGSTSGFMMGDYAGNASMIIYERDTVDNFTVAGLSYNTFNIGHYERHDTSNIARDLIYLGDNTYDDVYFPYAKMSELHVQRTLEISILDDGDTPLEDVICYFVNGFGDTVLVDTSDVNGLCSGPVSYFYTSSTVGDTLSSAYNDFNISASYAGADSVNIFTVSPSAYADTIRFGASGSNEAPIVTDIPNQTIAEGASFTTITLDNYVSDVDNTDAEMTWTYSGNSELTVDITARVATITIPNVDWNGAETITFRATDPGSLWDEDAALFTVTAENDPPVVTDIPPQTIAEGATFTTINLDNYVSDVDNTDAEMTWTYSGNTELTVDITSRVATITIPNVEWFGAETITFRATDPGSLWDEDAALFTVNTQNDSPVVTNIPSQTVVPGASFTTITLDNYVSDVDNSDAEMTWSYSGNIDLTVDITNRIATITIPDVEWFGVETITFRATDPGALWDDDPALFTVTDTTFKRLLKLK